MADSVDSQTTTENAQEAGPAPRVLTDGELVELLGAQQFGVLATVKRSGHPHLSTVLYQWDPVERIVSISTTEDRLKVRQIRNNPRVALHVTGPDIWSFAVAEGDAQLSEVTTQAGTGERRLLINIPVSHLYGTALDVT